MMIQPGNILAQIPSRLEQELFQQLLATPGFRLERIVSRGQATPAGEWYDQDWHEWVILLSGQAGLRIEGQADIITLRAGDYLLLPAHRRHRVEWTQPGVDTVWLALHYPADSVS